jgi:DNA-binding XRE family transcriptional regulator
LPYSDETQKCEKEYGNHPTNLCESCGTDNEANEMTPDKLIEVLKRYQRESNQSERTLAARIGVNHHTVNRWLKEPQCPMKGTLALAASFLRRVGYL